MSELEQIELARYREQITTDVDKLVEKYRRIFDWDIAEIDEAKARRLILDAIRDSIDAMG